jgi:hypothetical protein
LTVLNREVQSSAIRREIGTVRWAREVREPNKKSRCATTNVYAPQRRVTDIIMTLEVHRSPVTQPYDLIHDRILSAGARSVDYSISAGCGVDDANRACRCDND